MQYTNHWFVACGHGAELRVSGWSAGKRLRAGAKHLCGQTCLHKLVDEFLARAISAQLQSAVAENIAPAALPAKQPQPFRATHAAPLRQIAESTDQSSSNSSAYIDEFESSARLIPTPEPLAQSNDAAVPEPSAYTTRNWRAEAWKRERERTLRGDSRSAALNPHRRNIA